MANARISLAAPLNRQWWETAKQVVTRNLDQLTEYESNFCNSINDAEKLGGGQWNPTVKQFNFLRDLARRLEP